MLRKIILAAAILAPAIAIAQTGPNPAGGTSGPSANPPAMKGGTMPAKPETVKPNPAGGGATGMNANPPATPKSSGIPGTDPAKKDPTGGGTTGKP